MTLLLIEIAEIALDAAKRAQSKDPSDHLDVAHSIQEIVQKGDYAYQQHTGEPLDLSLIRIMAASITAPTRFSVISPIPGAVGATHPTDPGRFFSTTLTGSITASIPCSS